MATLEEIIRSGTPRQIPIIDGAAHQRQRIALDGQLYTLGLAWNQWASYWSLSLWDSEESPILLGLRVAVNWPLLRYYKFDPRCPPGEIIAHALTGNGADPGFDDFGIGKRVVLTYYAQT